MRSSTIRGAAHAGRQRHPLDDAALLTLAMPLMLSSLASAAVFPLFCVMMICQPLEIVSHGLERN
jgi:hypothetical protein